MGRLDGDFQTFFTGATGSGPFAFQQAFANELHQLVNVPTGLGKTAMVVVGWLWRRNGGNESIKRSTPRRLVYCLPMRVLVEQTSQNVNEWIEKAGLKGKVDVHVLMGGEELSDWDTNPERDSIIIGTQDMLISRALNRGYAMSRPRWPMAFGRSESWCEAMVLDDSFDAEGIGRRRQSLPLATSAVRSDQELIRVLCLDPEVAFSQTHVTLETTTTTGSGKVKVTTSTKSSRYDPAWNICMETSQMHKEKWSDPPGSKWVQYTRPRDCFKVEPATRQKSRAASLRPQVIRFALDSTVLPLATHTLPIAESARRMLMGVLGRNTEVNGVRGRSDVFSGKDERGDPLAGHVHTFFLPTDEDGDGRLDHLTLFSRDGFGPDEMQAIDRIRQIKPFGRDNASHPLRVLLLGHGVLSDYQPAPIKPSSIWHSVTPYIATRHAKTRGPSRVDLSDWDARVAFLAADLRAQLHAVRPELSDDFLAATKITPMPSDGPFQIVNRWRPIEFVRSRSKAGNDGRTRPSGAFRIDFPSAIEGPIALGTNSHFGMGLFLPS